MNKLPNFSKFEIEQGKAWVEDNDFNYNFFRTWNLNKDRIIAASSEKRRQFIKSYTANEKAE